MKILELKDITKKDSLIHYINKYECVLVYEIENDICSKDIHVILEKTAFGTTNIQLDNIDSTLTENIDLIKEYIVEQNKKGIFV